MASNTVDKYGNIDAHISALKRSLNIIEYTNPLSLTYDDELAKVEKRNKTFNIDELINKQIIEFTTNKDEIRKVRNRIRARKNQITKLEKQQKNDNFHLQNLFKSPSKKEIRKIKTEKRYKRKQIKREAKIERVLKWKTKQPDVKDFEVMRYEEGILIELRIFNNSQYNDITYFINSIKNYIRGILTFAIEKFKSFKCRGIFKVQMRKDITNEYLDRYFYTYEPAIIQTREQIPHYRSSLIEDFERRLREFEDKGSGWVLHNIYFLDLKITKYKGFYGSSYIPTPYRNRSVLNVNNPDDEKCHYWCTMAAFYEIDPNDHPQRVSHYQKLSNEFIRKTGIKINVNDFLMEINKIRNFEERNPWLSYNVYEKNTVNEVPKILYVSPHCNEDN